MIYRCNKACEEREKSACALQSLLLEPETWFPIRSIQQRPFQPLSKFATAGWTTVDETILMASFPEAEGIDMLVAWDQAGVLCAFQYINWRLQAKKIAGQIHFLLDATVQAESPPCISALTDVLFLTYLKLPHGCVWHIRRPKSRLG